MKTQNIFFRNLSTVVLVLSIFLTTSCGDDDDGVVDAGVILPAALVTTYNGSLSYNPAGDTPIVNVNATATISGSGRTYTISFSDGVPSITGVVFLQTEDNVFVSTSVGVSTSQIAINDGELSLGVVIEGDNWSFATN